MRYIIVALLLASCAFSLGGCGGGAANTSTPTSYLVNVSDSRATPKINSVRQNDTVQFLNAGTNPHQFFSGTLDPQGDPTVIYTVSIGNTGFNPILLEANLGDTIRFANQGNSVFFLDIVDDNGRVVTSYTLPIGSSQTVTFPSAGMYTVRNANDFVTKATVILFGKPNPNGLFQSPVLPNGGTFSKQFTQSGSFQYFSVNIDNPFRSFVTGTVNVQQ